MRSNYGVPSRERLASVMQSCVSRETQRSEPRGHAALWKPGSKRSVRGLTTQGGHAMNNKGIDERMVVLLLEEETMERETFSEYLERAGYAVLGACDCDEALSVLEDRPDVRAFVTDAHVPGCMDGFELAEVARTRWPHLAVVMM